MLSRKYIVVTPLSDEMEDRWLCEPSLRKVCLCQCCAKPFTGEFALSTTSTDNYEVDSKAKKTTLKTTVSGST